jgi:hypothetical protein
MSFRVAFDLDGVLADLTSAYRAVERRLFGAEPATGSPELPEDAAEAADGASAEPAAEESEAGDRRRDAQLAEARRRDAVWRAMLATENFWTTLPPLEAGAVPRLAALAARYGWEVVFLTQRPASAGEPVQRQTQRWLAAQGFDLPSVLVLRGSRGPVAAALHLDYLVDDTPQHCVDARAESAAKPILVVREPDAARERVAESLGIVVVRSAAAALDLIERAQLAALEPPAQPSRLGGWGRRASR